MRTHYFISDKLFIILLFSLSILASCSKDDSKPVEFEMEQREEEEEEISQPPPPPPTQSDINQVDAAVTAFMSKYSVPGVAVAVSINEKMVYTKGYGLSNVENNTPTNADDLFRVASISKVFTAASIMKLREEGALSLSDKVFGENGILGNDFGTATFTENELAITVDHLLLHESGGWGFNTGGDPIDQQPQLDTNEFIEYVFNTTELANAPGEGYDYSNMGFWLLARIVEKISGLSYQDYIQSLVATTGISTLKTTTFRQDDREANEVSYYGNNQDSPFIYTIASRRDGDGGVVISAPDLLRFMAAIDGFSVRPDVINSESLDLMQQPSAYLEFSGRGLGVWKDQNLTFFTGSLPGTRTWFYIDENGTSAVILLNYRRFDLQEFDNELNGLLYNIVKDPIIPWQTDLDQF